MTRTRKARSVPNLRLLWDENLSVLVPRALRAMEFRVSYVGNPDDDAPERGASDGVVIDHALKTRQVVVTQNHDMMTLCHERQQRFVWFDPRGKKLQREQQVMIAFTQIREWDAILRTDPKVCVRAMRTKCVPIASNEAARLATQRMRTLERRRRARSALPGPLGGLIDGATDE